MDEFIAIRACLRINITNEISYSSIAVLTEVRFISFFRVHDGGGGWNFEEGNHSPIRSTSYSYIMDVL